MNKFKKILLVLSCTFLLESCQNKSEPLIEEVSLTETEILEKALNLVQTESITFNTDYYIYF